MNNTTEQTDWKAETAEAMQLLEGVIPIVPEAPRGVWLQVTVLRSLEQLTGFMGREVYLHYSRIDGQFRVFVPVATE